MNARNSWSKALAAATLLSSTLFVAGAQAQDEPPPGVERLQYSAEVSFGETLNDSFETTAAGEDVRYMLVVKNGCRQDNMPPAEPRGEDDEPFCPTPADEITVTLNGTEHVFYREHRGEGLPVALAPLGESNTVEALVSAGEAGDGFQFAILAVEPPPTAVGGVDVLPWAFAGEQNDNYLTLHNPGRTPIFCRVLFFHPDGRRAGETTVMRIGPKATSGGEVSQIARLNQIEWQMGAIHVRWVSPRWNSLVSNMAEVNRVFIGGERVVRNARELKMESLGPRPVNPQEYQDVAQGQE